MKRCGIVCNNTMCYGDSYGYPYESSNFPYYRRNNIVTFIKHVHKDTQIIFVIFAILKHASVVIVKLMDVSPQSFMLLRILGHKTSMLILSKLSLYSHNLSIYM